MTRTLLPALTLWRREMVRFVRQRNRVFSAVAQPALFWALFGAGFAGSFKMDAGGASTSAERTMSSSCRLSRAFSTATTE